MTDPEDPLQHIAAVLDGLTAKAGTLSQELRANQDVLDRAAQVIEDSSRLIRRRSIFLAITIASVLLDIALTLGVGALGLNARNANHTTRTNLLTNCQVAQRRVGDTAALYRHLIAANTGPGGNPGVAAAYRDYLKTAPPYDPAICDKYR